MRKKKHTLTSTELEIMQIVWELGSCAVRDVYKVLLNRKDVAYTTVMTMLGVLAEKGHLKKHKDGRAYIYSPTLPQKQVISNMVDDFVKRVFSGSASRLVLNLVDDQRLSEEDVKEITRILDDAE